MSGLQVRNVGTARSFEIRAIRSAIGQYVCQSATPSIVEPISEAVAVAEMNRQMYRDRTAPLGSVTTDGLTVPAFYLI
jgi:hypothetical protein